jgi:hypothetical protein
VRQTFTSCSITFNSHKRSCRCDSLASAHHYLLHSKQHCGMPHLLADYLVAYDRDQQPLNALPSVSLARGESGEGTVAPT